MSVQYGPITVLRETQPCASCSAPINDVDQYWQRVCYQCEGCKKPFHTSCAATIIRHVDKENENTARCPSCNKEWAETEAEVLRTPVFAVSATPASYPPGLRARDFR